METVQQDPSNELSTDFDDSIDSIGEVIKLVLGRNGEIVPEEKKESGKEEKKEAHKKKGKKEKRKKKGVVEKKKKTTSPEYDDLTLTGIRVENFLLTGDDVPIFPIGLTETKKS